MAALAHPSAIDMPAPDPFDPASLRLDPGAELITVKKVVVQVLVRKPKSQEWVRVRPGADWRIDTALIELKEERETYLLAPALRAELGDEAKPTMLYTAINRAGAPFLWPIRLPGSGERQNSWHESAHRGAALAERKWTRLTAQHAASQYEIGIAGAPLSEPEWPADLEFRDLIRLAFRDHYIDSADHPVVRRLRGLV